MTEDAAREAQKEAEKATLEEVKDEFRTFVYKNEQTAETSHVSEAEQRGFWRR